MAWTDPVDITAGELTAAELNAIMNNLRAAFPAGKIEFFVRAATTSETTLAGGWLECNGVSVLRASYPALNTVLSGLSYPFGTVDGTHMTLPDLQGRALVAMSSGGHGDVNALNDSDGVTKASRTPKATIAGASAHTHSETAHTHGAGSYQVTLPSVVTAPGPAGGVPGSGTIAVTGTSASGGGGTTGSGGGGGGGTVSGAFLVAGCWFIKY